MRFLLALAFALCFASATLAQQNVPLPPPEQGGLNQEYDTNMLYELLRLAPSKESAAFVAQKIRATWMKSESPTVSLLIQRALILQGEKNLVGALGILKAIISIDPKYPQARLMRAQLLFAKQDIGGALEDLTWVLASEPRNFDALAGIGSVMQQIGYEKQALAIFRRLHEIYPLMDQVPEALKVLERKVEGQDI